MVYMSGKRSFMFVCMAIAFLLCAAFFIFTNFNNENIVVDISNNKDSNKYSTEIATVVDKKKLSEQEVSVVKTPVAELPASEDLEELSEADLRVKIALEKFEERTAHLTKELLQSEQDRVISARNNYESLDLPAPVIEEYIDDNGQAWDKMTFQDGRVRYQFKTHEKDS